MILMGPFHLEIFYDSMNTHVAVGIYRQANHAAFPTQTYTYSGHILWFTTLNAVLNEKHRGGF